MENTPRHSGRTRPRFIASAACLAVCVLGLILQVALFAVGRGSCSHLAIPAAGTVLSLVNLSVQRRHQ